MDSLRYMKIGLRWLGEARNFQRLAAIGLRATAVLLVPFSLVTFFKAGKTVLELPASGILGGVVFQILFVAAIYGAVQILFLRARDAIELPGVRYFMFPLAATVVRALGEAATVFIAAIAVGGGVYIWFTGKGIATVLSAPPPFLPVFGDTTFMGGIEFMAGGLLTSLALLGLTHLLAQGFEIIADSSVRANQPDQTDQPERHTSGSASTLRLHSGTDL